MKFNSKYAGQYYTLQGGEVYVLRGDGRFAYAGANTASNIIVQLTGYYKQGTSSIMYQTTQDGWIKLSDGWQNTGYAPIRQYTAKDAEYYVNQVIRNNAHILENNLFCARFASKLNDDEQYELYRLQSALQARNERIVNDGLCTDIKVSSPPGYSKLDGYLNQFMQAYANSAEINGVGVISTTAIIVVSCIVVGSLATAAYFAYKAFAAESEKDVKYSDELTKTLLNKLTPEEYEQLKRETNGIVTKTRLSSRFNGAFGLLKWLLIGAAGYVVYRGIKNKKGTQQ